LNERGSRFLFLWLFVVAIALSLHLGSYPLFDADEGRNGEVGREMAATNDYVMPRLDGMPYLDKPIVYFAAEAAAMEIMGPSEAAARLPALLFTFATAALLFWFARRIWDVDSALIAAIAYLSMPLTLAFSRTVIFDSALSFFMVLALVAFYCAVEAVIPSCRSRGVAEDSEGSPALPGLAGDSSPRSTAPTQPSAPAAPPTRNDRVISTSSARGWTILAWTAMAFGVLTKGPVAIVVPLIVAIPYAMRRRAFRRLWSWWGLVVFVIVIAPWVWAVSQAVPDFLQYVLVTETAQRLATKALKRTGAPWYFVPYVVGGALPWSILAMFAWRHPSTEHRAPTTVEAAADVRHSMFFVALWIVVPFVFFSISQSKRPQYILPVMPAIALAVAYFWRSPRRVVAVRIAAAVMLVLGIAVAAAPAIVHQRAKMEPEIRAGVDRAALPMGIAAIGGAVAALAFARRREIAVAALSLPIIAIPMAANPLLQSIGSRRSTQALVAQMRPYIAPDTQIIGIEAYTGSMSFYLQREISVATPNGEEFTSNYIIRHYARFADDAKARLRRPEWLQRNLDSCCAPRIYITRNKDGRSQALLTARGMRPIASDGHFVAFGPWRGTNRMQ
jgi:4-amino-4-deoxy-L-arabinose transferase-like glycosyltransferase